MLNFFSPREVTDMNQAVNAFLKFNKNSEVGEVPNFCSMFAANRIFNLNSLPWVFLQLFDAK